MRQALRELRVKEQEAGNLRAWGFRVSGVGFRVSGLEFRVKGLGLGFWVSFWELRL